ncbi:MAG: SAM-dependent DNA methyltransferase, partial [Prevotella sp.]|nr:SAM-dependent DNA methyltransferase [Prevotella sp.]
MAYNKRQKLQDNIAAIRTVFQLEKEGRAATDVEREVLKRYSGFGGLKFVLNPVDKDSIQNEKVWKPSDRPFIADTLRLHELLRESSKDDRQYREYVQSLKNSVLTSFYTPAPVIGAIAKVMKDSGVEVRSMLDPSAGIGKFGDAFKGEYPDVRVSAFEKDLLTGRILKALNPNDSVTIDGFETIRPELKGTFDVATSNIPFGDIKVMDDEYRKSGNDAKRYAVSTIHNYFFLKALDQVREGGFVAFITSRGFMDSPSNNPIREELAKNARLVGAFRLP